MGIPRTAAVISANYARAREIAGRFIEFAEHLREAARAADLTRATATIEQAGEALLDAMRSGVLPAKGWLAWFDGQNGGGRDRPMWESEAMRLHPHARLFTVYAENELADEAGFWRGQLSSADTRELDGSQCREAFIEWCNRLAQCCAALADRIDPDRRMTRLAEALDSLVAELDAGTIPTEGGRKIDTSIDADRLSRLAARLSSMLGAAVLAGIGDGMPVDELTMAAFTSASRLVALTPKQYNERRPRFARGDVLTHEQVESIAAAHRRLAIRAKAETIAAGREAHGRNLARDLGPMSGKERAVFEIIDAMPTGHGITGPNIIRKLESERGIIMELSTLTKDIIPKLKRRNVRNRANVGYYVLGKA